MQEWIFEPEFPLQEVKKIKDGYNINYISYGAGM
jgi:hypothetical protein